jgi:RNA polymerase sigma factor (sigma-70 family)
MPRIRANLERLAFARAARRLRNYSKRIDHCEFADIFCAQSIMSANSMRTSPSDALLAQRTQFKAFLVSRVGNVADAEDILQNGLIKAMQRAGDVRDHTKLTAWFYQLLRHAIIDHARSRKSATTLDRVWTEEVAVTPPEVERALCGCFEALLPELKPTQAALLRRVEIQGQPVAQAAAELHMTPNSASVTLHRARTALREKLQEFCGDCAKGACLDCNCPPSSA